MPGLRVRPQGESGGVIGSCRLSESDPSLNLSRLGSLSSACARRAATPAARVCPVSSSPAVSAAVAHVHALTLDDACPNSWSGHG